MDGRVEEETGSGKVIGMRGGCRSEEQPSACGSTPAGKHLIASVLLAARHGLPRLEPCMVVAMSICRLKSLVRISRSHQCNSYCFQQVF